MFNRRNQMKTIKPLARTEGLSVTVSGNETLVYDRERYVIHRLGADTARVWRMADGTRDLAALAADADLPMSVVESALAMLAANDLVQTKSLGKSIVTRRRLFGVGTGAIAASAFVPAYATSCDARVGKICTERNPGKNNYYRCSATGQLYCCAGNSLPGSGKNCTPV